MDVDIEKKYPDGVPSEVMSIFIWDQFRKAEEQWCCKATGEAKRKGAKAYGLKEGRAVSMALDYCPRCGRKLVGGI